MYQAFFNFQQMPFSIAPDPRFLFMSEQHKEALAHLIYGIQSSGAFVILSGEVGSGKTTVCRCFLDQVPEGIDIAFILNPKLTAQELLASICDELSIAYEGLESTKRLIDAINVFLLDNHSQGRNTVVVIEEAQNLSLDVLEQLRLLTNLETNEKKLLQIVLLAQPEFLLTLNKHEMRQLEQRITARFHLSALNKTETIEYIQHRLRIAGAKEDPFPEAIKKSIYKASAGVPRLINLLADRCLLGAYASNKKVVNKKIFKQALKEIKGESFKAPSAIPKITSWILIFSLVFLMLAIGFFISDFMSDKNNQKFTNVWLSNEKDTNLLTSSRKQSTDKLAALNDINISEQVFSFDDVLNLQSEADFNKQSDFSEAVSVLASLWGLEHNEPILVNGPRNLCIFAAEHKLECYSESGNIGLLLKLGRPAILKFVGAEGQQYYGVLLGLENDRLLIQFSEHLASLSFHDLEKIWLGEFFLLAEMPSAWKGRILQEGDDNALSLWLNEALNKIQNKHIKGAILSQEKRSIYTRQQVEQIKNIQKQAGLQADGKVGIKTIIFINSLISETVPRLQGVFTQNNGAANQKQNARDIN